MPLRVRTFLSDPKKTPGRRHIGDSALHKALFDLKVLNPDLTGVTLTFTSPVPGAAAIVLTAGVHFPAVAASSLELARAVAAAIDLGTQRLMNLNAGVSPDYRTQYTNLAAPGPGFRVESSAAGPWGESITLEINAAAAAANLEVNGTATAVGQTQNAVGGANPSGTQALETFLATLSPPGGGAPEFISLAQSTLASNEVLYTVVYEE